MKAREAFLTFLVVFASAFVASMVLSFVWSGFLHGAFVADWELATRMGLIFGLIITMLHARERRHREKQV